MEAEERVASLVEAQGHIMKAVRLITEAIADTDQERYVRTYMVGHLRNWAQGENTMDTTCGKLIQMFEDDPERHIY